MPNNISLFLSQYFARIDGFLGKALNWPSSENLHDGYCEAILSALELINPASTTNELCTQHQSLAVLTSSWSYDCLLTVEDWDIKKIRTLNEKEARTVIQKLLKAAPCGQNPLPQPRQDQLCEQLLPVYLEKSAGWDNLKETFSQSFLPQWQSIKRGVAELTIPPATVENLLKFANLPVTPEEITPPLLAMEFRWAVRFSPFIHPSFSLADFIFWMGEDPCAFAAI